MKIIGKIDKYKKDKKEQKIIQCLHQLLSLRTKSSKGNIITLGWGKEYTGYFMMGRTYLHSLLDEPVMGFLVEQGSDSLPCQGKQYTNYFTMMRTSCFHNWVNMLWDF